MINSYKKLMVLTTRGNNYNIFKVKLGERREKIAMKRNRKRK